MYVLTSHLDIQSLLAESAAATLVTNGLAGISVQHILVLNLIPVGLNPTEELIKAYDGLFLRISRTTFPNQFLDFLAQVTI